MRKARLPLLLDKPLVVRERDTCAAPREAGIAHALGTPHTAAVPASCSPILLSTVSLRREDLVR